MIQITFIFRAGIQKIIMMIIIVRWSREWGNLVKWIDWWRTLNLMIGSFD